MKSMGIKEARDHLREVVDLSQKDDVIILSRGKPVAKIVGLRRPSLDELWNDQVARLLCERTANPSPVALSTDELRRQLAADWAADDDRPATVRDLRLALREALEAAAQTPGGARKGGGSRRTKRRSCETFKR